MLTPICRSVLAAFTAVALTVTALADAARAQSSADPNQAFADDRLVVDRGILARIVEGDSDEAPGTGRTGR